MPPVKAIEVLVYTGTGTTAESVRHCLLSLRQLLSPRFAVSTITADVMLKEPWMSACALLVIPGGADVPYCRSLNGVGNRRISQYVRQGGSFIGFCAGGYYGSKHCEFEPENPELAVVGSRELAFFPGTCRGAALSGFEYASQAGASAPRLAVPESGKEGGYSFRSYLNGGGVFVDAGKHQDRGIEILASYDQELDVDGGDGKAAVVYCKVGDGGAILTGPHPEFSGYHLKKNSEQKYANVVDAIIEDDERRIKFLKSLLEKLGLQVPEADVPPPRLSTVHLTSMHSPDIAHLVDRLQAIATVSDSTTKIVDENDTFVLHNGASSFSAEELASAISSEEVEDLNKVPKNVHYHTTTDPPPTPFFNHPIFYASLSAYRSISRSSPTQFGTFLLYGETVTSTSTLLHKNPKLLALLPNGLTFTASTQVAGRGRGSNVWVSPKGCMIFSTLLRHSSDLNFFAPIEFIQYLVALAVIEAVKTYDTPSSGYQKMPVRLKWPNDIYALDPSTSAYVKIGGILTNVSYQNHMFNLVVGVGINTHNALPTTSLNLIRHALNPALPEFSQERLLARILVVFEEMYYRFCRIGWGAFKAQYEREWLHSGQVVTLEMHGGIKATVLGVTEDCGMLRVKEMETGRVVHLESDWNSFDFFKGLIKRKI